MPESKFLVVITGPTASGKTKASIELASRLKTEILSADARQIYREMNIGTAKPTANEIGEIPHHFIDHLGIEEAYSAGRFEDEALALIAKLHQEKDAVLLVGGSGFYIQAVVEGIPDTPKSNVTSRDALNRLYETEGIEALQAKLKSLDPDYYATVEQENHRRLIRAIEIIEISGKNPEHFLNARAERPFQTILIGMDWEREKLYERINLRVDLMVEEGLEDEARTFYPHRELQSCQTVGYQEWFDYFDEKISRDEAIALIKRNSRRYAKRQLTWWRKNEAINWFAPDDIEGMMSFIDSKMSAT